MLADEVVRPARKVGELRGANIDPQTLIERGEDVAEMNGPGVRLLAPAGRRAEHLTAAHAAARHQRAANARPMVAAAVRVDPRCAAELAPDDYRNIIQKMPLVQVLDQGRQAEVQERPCFASLREWVSRPLP